MPNSPACVPCKYPAAAEYMDRRMSESASMSSIRHELASPYRMKTMGFAKPPTLAMLEKHNRDHRAVGMVSASLPTFSGKESSGPYPSPDGSGARSPDGDIATAIQEVALQKLRDGELRITAQHALKAQEMLDRRAEKAQDRELTVLLARLMTKEGTPIALMLPDDAIEADYTEVEELARPD